MAARPQTRQRLPTSAAVPNQPAGSFAAARSSIAASKRADLVERRARRPGRGRRTRGRRGRGRSRRCRRPSCPTRRLGRAEGLDEPADLGVVDRVGPRPPSGRGTSRPGSARSRSRGGRRAGTGGRRPGTRSSARSGGPARRRTGAARPARRAGRRSRGRSDQAERGLEVLAGQGEPVPAVLVGDAQDDERCRRRTARPAPCRPRCRPARRGGSRCAG